MTSKATLAVTIALSLAAPALAAAADLPPIKASESNAVPECVTPGRLMAFIRSRNSSLEPGLEKIAVHYMRTGEELGLRWDIAFYQMAVETSYLTYKREGGRRGDVKPSQNNFAGLGATGNGAPGESFDDVRTGVLAHLQHVMHYSGQDVTDPVAERTRNIIKWGVLKSFHAKIKGPVTYTHLAQRWATSGDYAAALDTHARRFSDEFCAKADPNPELVAEARGEKPKVAAVEKPAERKPGAELARRAVEDGRGDGPAKRVGLGAAGLPRPGDPAKPEPDAKPKTPAGPAFTILNGPKPPAEAPVAEVPAKGDKPKIADKPKGLEKPKSFEKAEPAVPVQPASAGGQIARAQPTPPPPGTKCKVFTASYGGQKAILISAPGDGAISYTVLDVNDGAELREAEAYIAAYAKGGTVAGEFSNQIQALDKAFELCPEG